MNPIKSSNPPLQSLRGVHGESTYRKFCLLQVNGVEICIHECRTWIFDRTPFTMLDEIAHILPN